jgi:hypothetical protein
MSPDPDTPAEAKAPQGDARLAVPRSIVATILGAAFLGAGISKQIARDFWIETFTGAGLPTWFLHVIGFVEMAAAVMVLIPATRLLGAGLIGLVMIGAVCTHLMAGQILATVIPLTMLVLAGLLLGPLRPRVGSRTPAGAPPAHATQSR